MAARCLGNPRAPWGAFYSPKLHQWRTGERRSLPRRDHAVGNGWASADKVSGPPVSVGSAEMASRPRQRARDSGMCDGARGGEQGHANHVTLWIPRRLRRVHTVRRIGRWRKRTARIASWCTRRAPTSSGASGKINRGWGESWQVGSAGQGCWRDLKA